MTDTRLICNKCHNRLTAVKNGVVVKYTSHSVMSGDLWHCSKCKTEIIDGFSLPFEYDKESLRIYEDNQIIVFDLKKVL